MVNLQGAVSCSLWPAGASSTVLPEEKNTLLAQGLGLLAVILLQLVLRVLCQSLEVRIQGRLEISSKTKLLGKILTKDYAHTAKYHSGELMNRLTSDITVVTEGITTILPDFAGLLTKLLGAFAVLCIFDPAFTLEHEETVINTDEDGNESTETITTTEIVLHIRVTSKSHTNMIAQYGFNGEQVKMLDELMQDEYQQLFMNLIGS